MSSTVSSNTLPSNFPSKRKNISLVSDSDKQELSDDDIVHKRHKLPNLSVNARKTLFKKGQDSDVKVVALNKEWNLHRSYLSQSPYFKKLFDDASNGKTQKSFKINIEDKNITYEVLNKVLGFLYDDDIQIEPQEVVSVLASATLLQLDDLILQSVEVMESSINIDNALSYYEASEIYDLDPIKTVCLDWLYKNMVLKVASHPVQLMQQLSCDIMQDLVSSSDNLSVQTGFSLYLILKQWLILKEKPSFQNYQTLLYSVEQYFKKRYSGSIDGHECDVCGSLFASEDAMKKHRRMHPGTDGLGKHKCTYCVYSTSIKSDLINHIRTHTGEKPYKCPHCSMAFSEKSNLQKHLRTHTGERPYTCISCGKAFTQTSDLRKHERIHSGERPFLCPTCGVGFGDRSSLRRHERVHSGQRPHKCPNCDYRAGDANHLQRHVIVKHTRVFPHVCSSCGKGYVTPSELRGHMQKKHSDV